MSAAAQSAFERDTTVTRESAGAWSATVSGDWSAPIGPNGGYVAAIVLRAMEAAVDDPRRAPRSLTCHYLRAPGTGRATVHVRVERTGRNMTSVSARLVQDDRLCVLALGAFGLDFPSPLDYAEPLPGVPAPDTLEAMTIPPLAPPIAHRVEVRRTLGPPPLSGSEESRVGGWMRLGAPAPVDAALAALLTDALVPSAWGRLTEIAPAPTIDLTIHFRARLAGLPLDWVHGTFSSSASAEGFFEEDGVLHAEDGTLIAQSRQLALLLGPS